ncbi:GDSL-type esterase/lipase family protein [Verrucomicrobiales bacterium]|jgi:lysophospholipase L1-like esterase|nr:GDSL-type esterase/lipase family protein [Verrucomicrobiales bacterium]|tara:strand:- start:128 stop:1459 length:1332 start_codon:yes stop_codon:yes gene_type:complete
MKLVYFLSFIVFASSLILPLAAEEAAAPGFTIPGPEADLPGEGPVRRYEWFTKLWESKRSKWATEVKQDQGAVVFFGDSITQGWGADMKGTFGEMKVANRGISGDTTRGMLIRLQEDVLSLNPSAVVMLMGTNDLEEGATAEQITGNVNLIIAGLKQHRADLPIVLNMVFPSSETKKRPANAIKEINKLLSAAVKGDDQITIVDTWTLFAAENGDAKAAEFPDLLHPNEAGYAKWAAGLTPVFATLGLVEKVAEPFEVAEGFELLFDGESLDGWGFRPTPPRKQPKKPRPNAPVFVEIEEAESFDGKTKSSDGRYEVIAGRLVVKTPAEGRRIQQIWTTEEFSGDFILRLEFRATPNADSGVFIRKPQLQCRDYPLAGPYTDLKKYKPQDWNEMEVTVKGGVARATCNGEVLEEAMEVPETGPIGLEGDRGQMEYRRIRLKKF